MFLIVNLTIVLAYVVAIVFHNATGFALPLNITGMVWLLFVTPYNLTKLFKMELSAGIEKYFSWLTLLFFLFAPAYYIVHRMLGIGIDQRTILLSNLGVFVLTYIVLSITARQSKEKQLCINPRSFFKRHWLLIVGLALFAATHAVNYSFYTFIPEADGYVEILTIERYTEEGVVRGGKPAFHTSLTILAVFSSTKLYTLFTFWMITLQSTLVIALYAFLRIFAIQGNFLKFLLIATAVAVPVINMEVDIVRAQTFYILAFPIWAYFLYQALAKKRAAYWTYAGLISTFGMLYHELFFFLAASYFAILFGMLFYQFVLHAKAGKDRVIFGLSVAVAGALVFQFAQHLRVFQFIPLFLEHQFARVTHIAEWRIWFLHDYGTNVEGMGWSGWWGSAQYYGYYISPALIIILLTLVAFFLVLWENLSARRILIILAPLLVVYLTFAEILPRINAPYLPERFWLLITMALVLTAVPVGKRLEIWRFASLRNATLILYTVLLGAGISGSFYVAQGKGAEVSKNEYEAAQWIQRNTPEDAVFITQGKNRQMIDFFARRSRAALHHDDLYEFFLAESLVPLPSMEGEVYILYSQDKFNTIYAQREWWQRANFHGANLEKFNEAYLVVYDQGGVTIWKTE